MLLCNFSLQGDPGRLRTLNLKIEEFFSDRISITRCAFVGTRIHTTCRILCPINFVLKNAFTGLVQREQEELQIYQSLIQANSLEYTGRRKTQQVPPPPPPPWGPLRTVRTGTWRGEDGGSDVSMITCCPGVPHALRNALTSIDCLGATSMIDWMTVVT